MSVTRRGGTKRSSPDAVAGLDRRPPWRRIERVKSRGNDSKIGNIKNSIIGGSDA